MTPEEFCRQALPRTLPPRLVRRDPWLMGSVVIITVMVLWVAFYALEGVNLKIYVLVTYALLVWVFSLIGRRSRTRFRNLLQQGSAVQGIVSERNTISRELPKSTVTFYYIKITFPGGEHEPIKQTVPQDAWYRLKEASSVNVLYDPAGKNGYLLVDLLTL